MTDTRDLIDYILDNDDDDWDDYDLFDDYDDNYCEACGSHRCSICGEMTCFGCACDREEYEDEEDLDGEET